MYRLNIDRPTKLARLHVTSSRHSNCQPREKNPNDGHWKVIETIRGAEAEASKLGLDLKLCKTCMSALIETKAMGPGDKIFP